MWMDRAEKNPETDLNKYGQWFFFTYKGKSMAKKIIFSTNDVETVRNIKKKKNLNFNLIPYIKINSKLIINLKM